MKAIILTLFLFGSALAGSTLAQTESSVAPQPDPRIRLLEAALNRVQQEQQSVYQQFQMTLELRRYEIQEGNPLILQGPTGMGGVRDAPPIDYDVMVRVQQERKERIQQYTRDINSLYSRYSELGERRRTLVDQLIELAR
ncbi:MAG: hypothetical protein L0H75_07025 [Nitrosospira sp.]|nr:hypothetical protein [Nitrosospira sp.]MDN5935917.1 hypothetical protein [Nitrosospira sp.]